ncbi:MAG: potassium channel family protein [Chloroflexota bacterium]
MKKTQRISSFRWREAQASLRDTILLLREFGWPLFFFAFTIIGGGTLYYYLAEAAGEGLNDIPEAIYQALLMTFLQAGDFPRTAYLEIFYFAMPLIGLVLLAQGMADFGVVFFNRRMRSKEWEMAVASTFNNHIVLIGLGHLGFRVASHLHGMKQDVVAIELNPSADLVAAVKRMGIPVIDDDGTRVSTLQAARVSKARAILLCTQNDSMNLQIGLKARKLNPKIQVVLRIFDDDFADALQDQFGFTAFSATGMAAPAFAAAAAGVEMTRPLTIEGETLSLARLTISPDSVLTRYTAGELETHYNLSVVLLRRNHESDLHPPGDTQLLPGDALAVLGGPAEISLLCRDNHT